MTFLQKLNNNIAKNNSLLCIGLDTDINKIPRDLLGLENPTFAFNKKIIDETVNLVSCYKLNIAYYSASGISGINSLQRTIEYINDTYPNTPVILDAKRADVGSTSEQYAKEAFEVFKADAVTVNPYLGLDSIEPFLKYRDKGVIILCKTSNSGSFEFQDLKVENEPLYLKVAKKIQEWDKQYKNCLMVVGATYPEELKSIRDIAPDMFFLVPGIGKQGGDLEKTLKLGLTKIKSGLIIHSARAIIYASNSADFAEKAKEEAEKLKEEINNYRK
ncbi:orotidine-5'-phosphate decarboxylase [Candidatus Microgenomates bacterium]|nr:MAG: orotidine-5'-phosphate decarboxylase [Candidatus Microgenomates bacterium]